jgi:hypothetical protein
MWNQDGVTGKKLGIHVNQKEEGDWTFWRAIIVKGQIQWTTYLLITFCIDELKTSMSP